ncbi:MAG TPA: TonB-dependent receptor [Chitinophagaceae bacterium]|nr:TonB-dependent receptor [Chitinophagaceae bacterium]
MKIYLLIILSILCFSKSFAHSGNIQGKIIDSKTKQPIEYALVKLPQLGLQTISNVAGVFTLNDLIDGEYTLAIDMTGYNQKELNVRIESHNTIQLNIEMEPNSTQLKEVKIRTDQIANSNTISKIDIKMRPVNTSQDILRIVPGLFIAQHAGGGKAEQIFLRGFDCDHGTDINVSVDGMPVNMVSHAHGQGYADLHFVLPETIERVNVRKGPYNASIGNFATAGAVQFQTRNTIDNNLISLEGGNFNMFRVYSQINLLGEKAKAKNQNLFVAGEYYYRRGFFDQPDHLHRSNLFAKYSGLIRKHHRVTMQVSNFSSRWNASGQIPERAVANGSISRFGNIDPTEGGQTGRVNASLKVVSDLHHGNTLSNQIFFNTYRFNLLSNFTFYKNDTVNGDKIRQHEQRKIIGYNGSFHNSKQIGQINFSTELGVQARYDIIKNNELSNVTRENNVLNRYSLGDVNELNIAAYLNENIDINKNLRINIGLREDFFLFDYTDQLDPNPNQNNVAKAIFSPKLNLYYSLNKNLQLFLLSGIGFHSNDTRVVVAQNGYQTLPPAYGAEFGGNYKPNKNMLITASAWWLYLQQEFVYVGDEAVVEPSGRTQRYGIDIGLRYDIKPWLFADIDFNYAIPRALDVSAEENKIPLAPTTTSIGGLTAKFNQRLSASLRYRYLADRSGNESNSVIAKGYFINDLVVEYGFKKMIFGLSAENLFNQKWKEAQFETESQLKGESSPVSEIHFTSGTPLFLKAKIAVRF